MFRFYICSDGTSGLVYSESNHIVNHISLSLHFRTYISFIISGYPYYVHMLVTRLKSDMCLYSFSLSAVAWFFKDLFAVRLPILN